jgi:hypothetical protein
MNGQEKLSPSDLRLAQLYDDPDYARGDDRLMFLSMRGNGEKTREQYLDELDSRRKRRLQDESDRIEKLRERFFANETNIDLVTTHNKRRADWRREAKENQDTYLRDLEKRRLIYERAHWDPLEKRARCIEMLKNEERILKAISKWPSCDALTTLQPPTQSKVELDYGLKARMIYLNTGGVGHTHGFRHPAATGKYPNQKIPLDCLLADTDDNPLKEPAKPGLIRYFHLPANNMAWVEVKYY